MSDPNRDRPIDAVLRADKQLCPDCNAVMVVAEQFIEDEIQFNWYECSRQNCSGQWLVKEKPAF